jgi:hypothetical protein
MPTLQLFRRLTGFGLVLSLFAITAPIAGGADTTAVEEDWQLDLSVPNIERSSPQLNCFMSPTGDAQSYYTVFLINQHGSEGGGLELQLWNGSTLLSSSSFASSSLSSQGERIQWTSRMELSNSGVLTVQILSGTSTTWGKFGGKTDLIVSAQTPLNNLNGYSSSFTTESSGVEYGHGRVSKLILRKVRLYASNKKSTEQVLERVVHETK